MPYGSLTEPPFLGLPPSSRHFKTLDDGQSLNGEYKAERQAASDAATIIKKTKNIKFLVIIP